MLNKLEQIILFVKVIEKPVIIGISGFGGSGKSTLANMLSERIGAAVVGVDSFWRSNKHYELWEVVNFRRMIDEVIIPFKNGASIIKYKEFDWEANELGKMKEVAGNGILIIEGVGIFRPEILKHIDYSIWIDRSIEESIECGKRRDNIEYGVDNDELWDGLWRKNDMESFIKYTPIDRADFIWRWE